MKLRPLQKNEQLLLALILGALAFLGERQLAERFHAETAVVAERTKQVREELRAGREEEAKFSRRDLTATVSFPPLAELDRLAASSEKVSAFVQDLAGQGDDERFRILRLATEPAQDSPGYARTPIVLDVEASFPAIGRFLERLENAPFLAEVDSLEVYRVENDLRLCSAKIRLLSYALGK